MPTRKKTMEQAMRSDSSASCVAIPPPISEPTIEPRHSPGTSGRETLPNMKCLRAPTMEGRIMAASAVPCASFCGTDNSKVSAGTTTVPPPIPSSPDRKPVIAPRMGIPIMRAKGSWTSRPCDHHRRVCSSSATTTRKTPKYLRSLRGVTWVAAAAPAGAVSNAVAVMSAAALRSTKPPCAKYPAVPKTADAVTAVSEVPCA
mmetsp:Transcript_6563/g.13229  ORF Transcript_6563/g.13229 Transcript_6563/m.13229 type:complete len:202 (-) Transcript_6563:260-865(-)